MKRIALLPVILMVASCSSPAHKKLAVMYNPETKDTKECAVDPWHTWQWEYENVIQQCVKGYEAAGYKRVDTASE